MESKVTEYLNQINKEIERTVERIEEWRKELHKRADAELWNIEEFGTCRDGETLTKLAEKWKTLQQQKQIFTSIFELNQ